MNRPQYLYLLLLRGRRYLVQANSNRHKTELKVQVFNKSLGSHLTNKEEWQCIIVSAIIWYRSERVTCTVIK